MHAANSGMVSMRFVMLRRKTIIQKTSLKSKGGQGKIRLQNGNHNQDDKCYDEENRETAVRAATALGAALFLIVVIVHQQEKGIFLLFIRHFTVVIEIKKTAPTPAQYPRKAKAIKKKPL